MTRLNLLPYRDLAKIAETAGFHWVRCRGTHNTFRSPDGRVVVIPDHGSQVIVRPLLRRIIRDLGLTVNEYNNLVESLWSLGGTDTIKVLHLLSLQTLPILVCPLLCMMRVDTNTHSVVHYP